MDEGTKSTVSKLPLLTVRASPRDKEAWTARLREELTALIKYVQVNKEQDKDWFHIECNPHGTRWTGKCWYYYEQIRYEFDLEFDIPVTYPAAAPELKLPQLEGLTSKMYRGGKICQTIHFQPLWARNVPHFGIAHSLALSVRSYPPCQRTFAAALLMSDGFLLFVDSRSLHVCI
jgi:ufm1-conjugating enzyme 1